MRQLQQGEWKPALAELTNLAEQYPYDLELKALLNETQVRSHIDQDEREDRRLALRKTLVRWGLRLVVVVALAWMANEAALRYSAWFQQQVAVAEQSVREQTAALQLATRFADAQALLRAGRLAEAQAVLEEIAQTDPAYPGVQMLLNQVRLMNTLDQQYLEAIQLVQAQNWAAALPALQELNAVDPNYKDVALQLEAVEKQLLLIDLSAAAETVYASQQWAEAATAYEAVRALDTSYQTDLVEQRLFESYVQAARSALVGRADSLEALHMAEAYFRKALSLRPRDPEIKQERELARLYLRGQADFDASRWSDVITGLEIVYGTDPEYANGAARQTLYEARVARGDAAMANKSYEAALADYLVAVDLAERHDEVVLRLYEAYLRVGQAQAAQEAYEPAVLMYRKAVEVGKLHERALNNPTMAEALAKAEAAVTEGNFSLAYEQYHAAIYGVQGADATQATVTHVVQRGEYLVLIATRYHSTVKAIVAANNIENPRLIYAGQQLVIPVQP